MIFLITPLALIRAGAAKGGTLPPSPVLRPFFPVVSARTPGAFDADSSGSDATAE